MFKSENLVTTPNFRIENLVQQQGESENLHFVSSNIAMTPAPFGLQERRGKIRLHDVEAEVGIHAVAQVQAVKSAADQANAPPRKRQHAQPRPVGGLLENPPSATRESD